MKQQSVHLTGYHIFTQDRFTVIKYEKSKYLKKKGNLTSSFLEPPDMTSGFRMRKAFCINTSKNILSPSNHIVYNPVLAVMNSIICCTLRVLI